MGWEDPEDSGEDDRTGIDHERFLQHKAEYREWRRSVERRLAGQHQLLMWLIGALGTGAVLIVVALLTGGRA